MQIILTFTRLLKQMPWRNRAAPHGKRGSVLRKGVLALSMTALIGPATAASWFAAPQRQSATNDRAINSLYAQIPQATLSFQAGLELKRTGSPKRGGAKIAQSLEALSAAALGCAELPACDTARFFSAYQTLLTVQSRALGELAALDDDSATTDEVELEEGRERVIGAHLPQMHKALTLLKGRRLKDVITLNEPVKAALDEWLTWLRPQLIETYKNYAYMRPLMLPEYERAGLPEALLFGILAKESFARVHSLSKAGAAGPLQFMSATGQRYGLNANSGFDMRFDPQAAARANVSYINDQLGKLNNDLELTLAAYNGGEGRVSRLHAQTKKGFWNDQVYYSLPQETRDYVPKVLAAAYLFLHPEEFNLKFPEANGATLETELKNAMSLSELSICLGQEGREDGWFRTLRNLNPRIRPDNRMPAGTKIKIPNAAAPAFKNYCANAGFMAKIASLHDARNPSGPGYVPYVVRQGDTLAAIARRLSCTTQVNTAALATLNAIAAPKFAIKPGQRIKLPACG
jgi:membrane-bound lytic murein transglycosylase D